MNCTTSVELSSETEAAGGDIIPGNTILIHELSEIRDVVLCEEPKKELFFTTDGTKIETLEFHKMCRICLSVKPCLQSLFSNIGFEIIADMLMSFASIQVEFGEGLPDSVCSRCRSLIKQCFIFKQQCERSETILRNFIFEASTDQQPDDDDDNSFKIDEEELILGNSTNDSHVVEPLDSIVICNESDSDSERNKTQTQKIRTSNRLKKQKHTKYKEVETTRMNADHEFRNGEAQPRKLIQNKQVENSPRNKEEVQGIADKNFHVEFPTCEVCLKIFSDNRRLTRHRKIHLPVKPHICNICKKGFAESGTLRRHMLKHENNPAVTYPFPCPKCRLGFTSESDLSIHSSVHSETGQPKCLHCGKVFPTQIQLRRHVRTHLVDKPHKCDICMKGFPEKASLTRHYRRHNGQPLPKKYVCAICGKGYVFKHQLIVHTRLHTGERPCVCAACGKSFTDIRLLNSHMRLHSDDKPHTCKVCEKKFRHEQTLICHLRVHTGERPFVCKICGKTFKQLSNLSLHLKRHRGEKPFGCDVCNRRFTSSSTLRIHSRVHTGEKPYECLTCGKRFARRNMSIHMRTHTGEKPFPCSLCPRKFCTQNQLNKHSQTHNRNKPYMCPVCGKGWLMQNQLKRHLSSHQTCSKLFKPPEDEESSQPTKTDDRPSSPAKASPGAEISACHFNQLLKRKVSFVTTDSTKVTTIHLTDPASDEQLVEMAQMISVAGLPEGTFNIVALATDGSLGTTTDERKQLQTPSAEENDEGAIFQLDNGILTTVQNPNINRR